MHLALTGLLDYEPDLVVSGINHGANLGDDVIYSGTVAAAMEGRFLGLPTIAVSLVGHDPGRAKLSISTPPRGLPCELVQKIERVVAGARYDPQRQRAGPALRRADTAFVRRASVFVTSPSRSLNDTDPYGRPIYWVGPAGEGQDAGEGTDFHAIEQGAVSVTPLKVDLTRHDMVPSIADWLER